MAKNIGTLAILSENATLLSENCCSCKCLVLTFIFFLFALEQQKKREEKSNLKQFHTEPKKCTGQNYWHPKLNIWWHPLWKKITEINRFL